MQTPNLKIDPLVSAQAQKHVTVNEAFARIDAATQLAVLDRDLPDPPTSPDDGDRYLLPPGATGAWAGHDGKIAMWDSATVGWLFLAPRIGWRLWVIDEEKLVVLTDSGWQQTGSDISLNPATGDLIGVNTTADTTNRLAVKTDAALFSHDDITPGSGDMRLTLNMAAAGNDTSLTMQTAFSARAQMGLTGSDDFHIKVSPDGTTFHDSLVVSQSDGSVRLPGGFDQQGMLITDTLEPDRTFSSAKHHFSRLNKFLQRDDGSIVDDAVSDNIYSQAWCLSARDEVQYGTTDVVWLEAADVHPTDEFKGVRRIVFGCGPHDRALFNEVRATFTATYTKAPDFKVVASDDLATWSDLYSYTVPGSAVSDVAVSLTTPAKAYRYWALEFSRTGTTWHTSDTGLTATNRLWIPLLNIRMRLL